MTDSKEVFYTEFHPRYLHSSLQLLNSMWDLSTIQDAKQRFEWRYMDNYCIKEGTIFVAIHDDKVIGFRGFTAQWYWLQGLRRIVLSPSDAVVAADYRRYGVFRNLTEFSLKQVMESKHSSDLSVYLNLSSNRLSSPGYVKIGWQELMPKQYFTRFSIRGMLSSQKKPLPDETSVYKLSGGKALKIDLTIDTSTISGITHFEQYRAFHDTEDEFYKWRYAKPREKYRFISYSSNDTPMAFMIVAERGSGVYAVLDYCASSEIAFRELINASTRYMGFRYMRLFLAGGTDREKKCLAKAGFVSDSKLKWLFPNKKESVLIRRVDTRLEHNAKWSTDEILDPSVWRILGGEIH